MASKKSSGESPVRQSGSGKKTVTVSDDKGNSTTVRRIENGYLTTVSKMTKTGYSSKDVYSKAKPKIEL